MIDAIFHKLLELIFEVVDCVIGIFASRVVYRKVSFVSLSHVNVMEMFVCE